jgi:hypothetical protein
VSPILRALAIAGALGALSLLPQHLALADPPTHQFDVDLSSTVVFPPAYTGCSVAVTIAQVGTGTVTTYYDQTSNVTKVHITNPSDFSTTFSANGHSYTSVSPASSWTFYVNGTPTQVTINGLEAHLKLPGMGFVAEAVGHFVTDLTTGTVIQNGQWTISPTGNWSPEVCALFAP